MVVLVLLTVAIAGACASLTLPVPVDAAEKQAPSSPRLERVAELYRLYVHWKEHCDEAFVTPEVTRLYDAAVQEMDEAGYGYGRNSNFAGVKPPRAAWVECAENGG
jgi:hypothetical protein